MKKLTRKQILARLFIAFFTISSTIYTTNPILAENYGTYTLNNEAEEYLTNTGIKPTPIYGNTVLATITQGIGTISDIYSGFNDDEYDNSGTYNNTLSINKITENDITINNVFGGFAFWDTEKNKVFINNCHINNNVYGGKSYNGCTSYNEVTITGNSIIDGYVYGGLIQEGNASDNSVTIDTSNANHVYGGFAGDGCLTGSAIGNKVTIINSSHSYGITGGNAYTGDASENEVSIKDSQITDDFIIAGGKVDDSGDASENIVTLDNVKLYGISYIYGGKTPNGQSNENSVTIRNGSNAEYTNIYGGYSNNDTVSGNKVTISSSTLGYSIYGGYSENDDAFENEITIENSTVNSNVYGSYSYAGSASDNNIIIDNSTVNGELYGGYSDNYQNTINNTITLKNSSFVSSIYGGSLGSGMANNELIVVGSGNKADEVYRFEYLTFKPTSDTDTPFLEVVNLDTSNLYSIDTKISSNFNGTKTLVKSENELYDLNLITYCVNGETTDGSYSLAYTKQEYIDVGIYQYDFSDRKINLTGNAFITGEYKNNDIDLLTQDATINVDSSIVASYSKIFGAYSLSQDSSFSKNDATGSKVKLTEKITSDNLEVYGGYSEEGTVSDNTFEVLANAAGSKVKKIESFDKFQFTLASDLAEDNSMLFVDSISLDNANVNTVINNNFSGTRTIITSTDDISKTGAKFYINSKELAEGQSYNLAAAEAVEKPTYVAVGAYQYDTSSAKNISILRNNAIVTGVYNNDTENIAATDNTLIVSPTIANSYTDVYGAYSANSSDATGATVKVSEKISSDNLNIHGGLSNGGSVSGNTFELAGEAAGSKVSSIEGFDNYKFTLSPELEGEDAVLEVGSIVLDNAILDTDIGSGFNGTRTIITSTDDISKTGAKFYINNTELAEGQSYHIAAAEPVETPTYVAVGAYQYDTSSAKNISIHSSDAIVTGAYNSDTENIAATDNTLVVNQTIANNYTDIYGVYSVNNSDATGATVKVSEKISSDKLNIHGGLSNGGNVSGNTFELAGEAAGSKVSSIEGFDNYKLALSPELEGEDAVLEVGSIVLDNAILDTDIGSGFNGTKTIITSTDDISKTGAKFYINNTELAEGQSYNIAAAEPVEKPTYVAVGSYQYDTSSAKDISIHSDAILTGAYNSDTENIAATDNTLVVSKTIANSYTDVYGAYSANNSDATGATVKVSEKISSDNLNIHGGLSNGGSVSGNTFEITSEAAGSRVSSIEGFDNYKFALSPEFEGEDAVIEVGSIVLDNALLDTDIGSGFNGTRTIITSTNDISKEGTKFYINNTELAEGQSYHIASAEPVEKPTYISVDSYQYDTISSDRAISISNTNALAAGIYCNGSEKLAATDNTLVVSQAVADKFNDIYGAYSADSSDATGATVKVSEKISSDKLNIHGGMSNGGSVSDNTFEIAKEAAGSQVNSIEGFDNYKIVLDYDMPEDTAMITTLEKLDLNGVTINVDTTYCDFSKKGEKFVLLENTENKASKLLIDGMEGEKSSINDTDAFVAVTKIGYADEKDEVALECKDAFAAGIYIDESSKTYGKNILTLGNAPANGNVRAGYERAVTTTPDLSGYEDIYGVYTEGATPSDNAATVEIVSAIDLSNSRIHGGFSKKDGFFATGNTLSVKTLDAKAKGISNFENMDFVLPPETKNGSTMLKVTEAVDMAPTQKIGVEAVHATLLRKGDSVNLIDSEGGIQNFGKQEVNISGLTDKKGEVVVAGKAITLSIEAEAQNQNTKAPVEGIAGAMANINAANDLTSNNLYENMVAVTANAPQGNFAAMNGGHNKFHTGSYVESDSWNLGFGVGKKGLSKNNPNATFGAFVQYGKSTFTTHNDNFRGDGDNKVIGGGIMFHQDGRNGYYYNGNIFAGKVDTKWSSAAGSYDDHAPYHGFTFGMGKKHSAGNNRYIDVYGRYTFSHVGSMEGNIGGYHYDFASADSSNIRLGMRSDYVRKNKGTAYWGLAWEHEFEGDFDASMNLGPTESPSLHGDTGIVEIGYEWERGNWIYNLNAEGAFGKREGISGALNINYNF